MANKLASTTKSRRTRFMCATPAMVCRAHHCCCLDIFVRYGLATSAELTRPLGQAGNHGRAARRCLECHSWRIENPRGTRPAECTWTKRQECNRVVSTIALLTQEIAHQVCCVRDNSKLLKEAERFHEHPILDDL